MGLERARFCDLPVENPLWKTEILRYDAALDAHNLPAMERERESERERSVQIPEEGFALEFRGNKLLVHTYTHAHQ